ncbi:hypothetical protein JCM18918_3784 [Cutibacterium acnes JCM 18918]|nr:hypothetical protein JCM18918_3784 [Cutibacterium acnes JCM 18918]
MFRWSQPAILGPLVDAGGDASGPPRRQLFEPVDVRPSPPGSPGITIRPWPGVAWLMAVVTRRSARLHQSSRPQWSVDSSASCHHTLPLTIELSRNSRIKKI